MTTIYLILALILLLSIVFGLLRIIWGPTAADRMMVAQLFGTCGVAILLLISKALGQLIIEDVALIFAMLAVLSIVAFVCRAWETSDSIKPEDLDHG